MTTITIVHESGTSVVDVTDEHFIEEVGLLEDHATAIRVWHDDPEFDDDAYTEYHSGTIVEVDP